MLDKIFKDMNVARFLRLAIMLAFGGDIILALFLNYRLTEQDAFKLALQGAMKILEAKGQAVMLDEEQMVRVYHVMRFQVKAMLALFLGIHALNYYFLNKRKKGPRKYTSMVVWLAAPCSLFIGFSQLQSMPGLGIVFLLLCPAYLWVALGLHHYKSEIGGQLKDR